MPTLVALGLGAVFIAMSVGKYFALGSFFLDLGVFQTWLINVSERGELGRIFLGHSHIAALPYIVMLKILPDTLATPSILVLQAVALVAPVWFLCRRFGRFAAFAFALYVPLWINNHFDFHFDHLAVPLLLWFFLSTASGKLVEAAAAALLLMTIKEPFALQTMACGLFLVWVGFKPSINGVEIKRRRFTLAGLMLVFVGGSYFYFATHYLIPYFTGGIRGGLDADAFSWLGRDIGEMVSTLLTHPLEILSEILNTPGKLVYLFVVFGQLAFISLLAPGYLIPALPLLAVSMLSRAPNFYDYNTHYTAGLIIPVMFAFTYGLPKAHALWMVGLKWVWRRIAGIREKLLSLWDTTTLYLGPLPQGDRGYAVGAVTEMRLSKIFYVLLALWILGGHVMLSPSPISRLFWSDKVWSYSWRAYAPTEREAMMKKAMLKYIPADPEVSVTTQNTVNWYHLAYRKVYSPFPHGIEKPIQAIDWSSRTWEGFWRFVRLGEMPPAVTHDRYADYVVLDLKRPWFIVDKGCEWIYGECRDMEKAREFLDLVAKTKDRYEVLFERDSFMILKRR